MDLLDPTVVPDDARDVKADAREFATAHIEPNAADYFDSGEYPMDVVEAARDANLVAQEVSPEYGGKGASVAAAVATAEEFFRADAGLGLAMMGQSFGTNVLEEFGTEAQKEEYLRPVAEYDAISGMAISEPETGSDLTGMQTTAERDGDEWVLDGEKYWIGNGIHADFVLVYAKTGDGEDRHGNHSLIVVPTDTPGYEAEHIEEKMGMRASEQAHITLDDCRVPAANLVGEEGDGFRMLAEFFNHGRIRVAGQAIGLAAAAIEEAWSFVHDREEFGRSVSDFQSVRHDLADMRNEFESARTLLWEAVDRLGEDGGERWASMAKLKATETAAECAETAVGLHGGWGVLDDSHVARVYRDVRMPMIYEGVSEVQRDIVYDRFE